ncbi:PepSY-associated TM helix domain-containing protein [Eilatimonas milleporae]|uniref:Putative iron-regulated membrane protein n=1 Tax=Eilatimonas milleporae TaxID=911205 RepID=A0A3M0CFK2_9PROT|nr:PepSY-associated TM helix domain-containing protein [Eilatimonas milleporae]RMB08182.1 putative iron-regulated membrane protein [Eilatimonas milleporae]
MAANLSFRKLHAVHAWTGVITALVLFVIVLTGAVAVFARVEVAAWADPSIGPRLSEDFRYDATVRAGLERFSRDHGAHGLIIVFPPRPGSGVGHVSIAEGGGHSHDGMVYQYDAGAGGRLRAAKPGDTEILYKTDWTTPLSSFLVHLHTDLWLPAPWGRFATGFLGLTLLISAVSGVVIHRKLFRRMFSFRRGRSRAVTVRELHKTLGVWTLLFNLMIGFTGTLLSFATALLLPAVALVSFGGDMERIEATFVGAGAPSGVYARTADLDGLMRDVGARAPGFQPTIVHLHHFDDAGALVDISGFEPGNASQVKYRYHGASGAFAARLDGISDTAALSKTLALLLGLHFGNFAGPAVKAVWSVLGIVSSLLVLTGMMTWIERRALRAGARARRGHAVLSRLTAGVGFGLPLALAGVFAAAHLTGGPASMAVIQTVFWAGLVLSFCGMLRVRDLRAGMAFGAGVTGMLWLLAPALKATAGGEPFWQAFARLRFAAGVADLVLIGLGVLFMLLALRLARRGTVTHDPLPVGTAPRGPVNQAAE